VLGAVEAALKVLAALPRRDDIAYFVSEAERLKAVIAAWETSTPSSAERERVLQRVLALHVAVAKLRR
jgi:hypothetical protein